MHLALTGADRNKLLMSRTVAAVKNRAAKRRQAARAADVAEKVPARRRSLDDTQVGGVCEGNQSFVCDYVWSPCYPHTDSWDEAPVAATKADHEFLTAPTFAFVQSSGLLAKMKMETRGYQKRPCPKSHREVRSRDDKQVWISAEKAHIDKCADIGVWELVPPTYAGITNVMGSTWAYSHNPSPMDPTVDLPKARVVVRGFTQRYDVDYTDTASPALPRTTCLATESEHVRTRWIKVAVVLYIVAYVAMCTRPDLSHRVSYLQKFAKNY